MLRSWKPAAWTGLFGLVLTCSMAGCTATALLGEAAGLLGGIIGDPNIPLPGGTPTDGDRDGDGLTDDEEAELGTNPERIDTDGDRVGDADEVAFGTDPTRPNAVGTVSSRLCTSLLFTSGIPSTGNVRVFRASASISRWQTRDVLILSDNGDVLINKTRGETSPVELLGAPGPELQIVSITTNGESLRLSDGSFWRPDDSERFTVLSWQPTNRVRAITGVSGETVLINVSRCEGVGASPAS